MSAALPLTGQTSERTEGARERVEGQDTGCVVVMRTPACQRGDEGESVYESATMVECAENDKGSESENGEGSESESAERWWREGKTRRLFRRYILQALYTDLYLTQRRMPKTCGTCWSADQSTWRVEVWRTLKCREHWSAWNVKVHGTSKHTESSGDWLVTRLVVRIPEIWPFRVCTEMQRDTAGES